MNNQFYNLDNPITQVITNIITKFTIENLIITPFEKATMLILLYDDNNKLMISRFTLVMSGEDYLNWDSSDEYLINWINKELSKYIV